MYQTSRCQTCTGCDYSFASSGTSSYSGGLESIAHQAPDYQSQSFEYSSSGNSFAYTATPSYSTSIVMPLQMSYSGTNTSSQLYQNQSVNYSFFQTQKNYAFSPDDFLKPGKEGKFIGKAEEIREHLEEAFAKIFNFPFPSDIKISVLDEKRFRKIAPHPSTIGLSINRKKQNLISEIFVKNDFLARVMLTIGHELGHVLTKTLDNPHDEEAKAYAFSLEWMRTIKEHNLANLKDAIITEQPAENGLHNIAFSFVQKLIRQGKRSWEIYLGLIKRIFSVQSSFS